MAKSQLLKDAVSGKESMESILLRLNVILSDLDYQPIIDWVNGELKGYEKESDVPKYRVIKGNITGNYVTNLSYRFTNATVPLELLLEREEVEKIETIHMVQSIKALENMVSGENKDKFGKPISAAYCHQISQPHFQIANMQVGISSVQLDDILSVIKFKVMEIIKLLEKQFDVLDELDIASQINDEAKKEAIIYYIENIIFDRSITIGDNNKISKSEIGNIIKGLKN